MGQGWGGRHAARGGAAAARPLQAVAVGAGVRPRPAPPLAGRGRPLLTELYKIGFLLAEFCLGRSAVRQSEPKKMGGAALAAPWGGGCGGRGLWGSPPAADGANPPSGGGRWAKTTARHREWGRAADASPIYS